MNERLCTIFARIKEDQYQEHTFFVPTIEDLFIVGKCVCCRKEFRIIRKEGLLSATAPKVPYSKGEIEEMIEKMALLGTA